MANVKANGKVDVCIMRVQGSLWVPLLVLLILQSATHGSQPQSAHIFVNVTIDMGQSPFSVDERFLSISLSPKRVLSGHKESVPWSSSLLQVLARGISPAWLRVGGTESDYVIFVNSSQIQNASCPQSSTSCGVHEVHAAFPYSNPEKINLTQMDWDNVNRFAMTVGWKVLFGLNVQLRTSLGAWNSTNAASLIKYTYQKGYQTAWGLGNEPTQFGRLPNTTAIDPQQLADDFHSLNELLTSISKMEHFVSGPDISKPSVSEDTTHMQYLQSFLDAGSMYGGVVNAITWHQYYVSGRTATLKDFLSPSVMDIFLDEILKVRSVTANYTVPLWLGETASASAGGAFGLSDTYAAGFLFLDKLGMAAATNLSVLMKQTLIGANYGLLDLNLNPLPPYWLSLLHKNLVGSKVLLVKDGLQYGRTVRVYSHCTKVSEAPNPLVPVYSKGDITLLVINLCNSTAGLVLQGSLMDLDKDIYFLTPLDSDLESKFVALNGNKLSMTGSGELPQLVPMHLSKNETITIPGLSYGLVVIKYAKADACL